MGIGATAGAAAVGGIALNAQASSGPAPASGGLVFDTDGYTEQTTTITDANGDDHEVIYRFWKAVTYVAKPVDEKYQSLNVSAPVKIDGTSVDASGAPILFANSVGGYMPSSVADATGVGAGGTGGPPGGGGGTGKMVSLPKLALAAGYVVVEPGARGRTLKNSAGEYYGTAPAAIVDLKAAVRYVRANKGRIPGDTDRIVSSGTSAGGALSSLLGASGDSPLYEKYLRELGAADASDAIFATGAWCPITDLEHADGAYEWNWGTNVVQGTGDLADRTVSKELLAQFAEYQASLKLRGLGGFGTLTARNYDTYLLKQYMEPSATAYLKALSDADRAAYLADNTFITWKNGKAGFSWADFLTHVGARKKNAPSFDAFDLSTGENNLFGTGTTGTRHFTAYGLKHDTTGNTGTRLDGDIPAKLRLMNPMPFLTGDLPGGKSGGKPNAHRSRHWWIRLGTKDSDTSHTISANLAAAAAALGDDVSHLYYWDQGHGANTDPGDFIEWIAKVTGHRAR
ncbi:MULTISPECIES: subtype B tannase [Streptomyces]|uniref:Alpha/beta hydrolase n=1 Tax=Streptomyces koelreuteriae TaxID=2838015 RepID=A0ABX8G4R0_9ACTN|nr:MULTISPECIES: subtype B tannase [Streptomyces]QWB28364.1 alpha/beta hydrolase [Streptomyces koelreuteriae]UUA11401.1 alpha/beta hydrolase [Streptomyces koelreuteriae]UUA19001.1 alpha/beta hydrolase [Streptomyces sp. CRCS-T-1]